MIEDGNDPIRLPRHGHIFQQFKHGMGGILQGTEVDPFILLVALGGHVSVIQEDFANVLGG